MKINLNDRCRVTLANGTTEEILVWEAFFRFGPELGCPTMRPVIRPEIEVISSYPPPVKPWEVFNGHLKPFWGFIGPVWASARAAGYEYFSWGGCIAAKRENVFVNGPT